jgi:multiple sugar transport system ATP-binding protein
MPRVEFHNVNKIYPNGACAVSNLDLTINDGEYMCLLGPSGCGKSSTLRMLAGLETVSEGEIGLDGRRYNEVPPQNRDMAMVFENYALYPHLDAFDNIAMPLVARGKTKAEIATRVAAVAAMLGLETMLNKRPHQLSGGQRQRVSIGRAIIREPKMFLMDEPLGHLEAYLREQLRAEMRRLHERLGTTTVHITHDQEEAAAVSDRIALMNQGRLQQVGTIVQLLDTPANRFVAEFIGSPPINLLPVTVVETRGRVKAHVGDFSFELPSIRWGWLKNAKAEGPLTLGTRPEDLSIAPLGSSTGLSAKVMAVEPQGSESVLIAETPAGRVSLMVSSVSIPEPGTALNLAFNIERVHLFQPDGVTLLALRDGAPAVAS